MILETKNYGKKGKKFCICKCDICGKEFRRKYSEIKKVKHQYCSLDCERKDRKGRPKSEQWKNKMRSIMKGRVFSEEHKRKLKENHAHLTGENNPNWNGGRCKDSHGYICVRKLGHPETDSRGYVKEHRLIVAGTLGRELTKNEEVHHMDENKGNNDISNLYLFTKKDHRTYHLVKRVLDEYGTLKNFVESVNILNR